MKKSISILLPVLLLVGVACTKKNQVSGETTLRGTWRFVEYYSSPGGPGSWRQADPAGQTITFEDNGKFKTNGGIFNNFSEFQELDSVTIRMIPVTRSAIVPEFRFEIDNSGDGLTLSPSNPVCIEGCAYRFERVFIR